MKQSPEDFLGAIYTNDGNKMVFNRDGTAFQFYEDIDKGNGDMWTVVYVLLEIFWQKYYGLPPDRKPSNWSIVKQIVQGTGIDEGRQQYTVSFITRYPPDDVEAKPDTIE